MLTAEQIQLRRSGLAATDLVRLSGASPWGTAHDVYREKTAEPDDEIVPVADARNIGQVLEPLVLELLADARGLRLTPGKTERHASVPHFLATPDANVVLFPSDPKRIAVAEVKCVGARLFHKWADDEIPDYVRVQVAWQCLVCDVPRAYVGALLGTEFRSYIVEREPNLEAALCQLADGFWRSHVLTRLPPAPDGSESARKMLASVFRKVNVGLVSAPAEAEEWAERYRAAKAAREAAETDEETAKQNLQRLIGENEGIESPHFKATWKWQKGGRVEAFDRKPTRTFRFTDARKKAEAAE